MIFLLLNKILVLKKVIRVLVVLVVVVVEVVEVVEVVINCSSSRW